MHSKYALLMVLAAYSFILGCSSDSEVPVSTTESDTSNADRLTEEFIALGNGPRRVRTELPSDVDVGVLHVLSNYSEMQNQAIVSKAVHAITGTSTIIFPLLQGQWRGTMRVNGMQHNAHALADKQGLLIIDVPAIGVQYYLKNMVSIDTQSASAILISNQAQRPIKMKYSNAAFRLLSEDVATGGAGYPIGQFSRARVNSTLNTTILSDIKISPPKGEEGLTMYFDAAGNGALLLGECQLALQASSGQADIQAKSHLMSLTLRANTSSDCRGTGLTLDASMAGIMSIDSHNNLSINVINGDTNDVIHLNLDLESVIARNARLP